MDFEDEDCSALRNKFMKTIFILIFKGRYKEHVVWVEEESPG